MEIFKLTNCVQAINPSGWSSATGETMFVMAYRGSRDLNVSKIEFNITALSGSGYQIAGGVLDGDGKLLSKTAKATPTLGFNVLELQTHFHISPMTTYYVGAWTNAGTQFLGRTNRATLVTPPIGVRILDVSDFQDCDGQMVTANEWDDRIYCQLY